MLVFIFPLMSLGAVKESNMLKLKGECGGGEYVSEAAAWIGILDGNLSRLIWSKAISCWCMNWTLAGIDVH